MKLHPGLAGCNFANLQLCSQFYTFAKWNGTSSNNNSNFFSFSFFRIAKLDISSVHRDPSIQPLHCINEATINEEQGSKCSIKFFHRKQQQNGIRRRSTQPLLPRSRGAWIGSGNASAVSGGRNFINNGPPIHWQRFDQGTIKQPLSSKWLEENTLPF